MMPWLFLNTRPTSLPGLRPNQADEVSPRFWVTCEKRENTVVWKPEAERRLAELWMEARDPERLSEAANLIDRELSVNPASIAEQRVGSIRVVFVPPLGV